MLKRRVEILFEPEKYALLEEVARARKTSVGALVREAVERELLGPTAEERQSAVQRLISQDIDFGSWDAIKKDIRKGALGRLETAGH